MSKQNSVFSPDDFLSRPQVAEILGVCKSTVTLAIERGWLETVLVGTRHYVLRETIQEIVADHEIADLLGLGKGD
jgi:predicted transcriptional regulator